MIFTKVLLVESIYFALSPFALRFALIQGFQQGGGDRRHLFGILRICTVCRCHNWGTPLRTASATQDEVLLTARHVQVAGLLVQGEEGEVHGAGARDGDPAT